MSLFLGEAFRDRLDTCRRIFLVQLKVDHFLFFFFSQMSLKLPMYSKAGGFLQCLEMGGKWKKVGQEAVK